MRGNHQYYDVSDLNAPYDQIPFQGIGGGSLGGSNTLGISDSEMIEEIDQQMPWKEYSAYTVGFQMQLNKLAKERGYCQIDEDGRLGPLTCGLSNTLNGNMPGTCQSQTAPKKQPCSTPQTGGNFAIQYPWGRPSPYTRALQISLNEKAAAAKLMPLAITGALDAKTCGMTKHFGGTPPSECQAFTEPTPLPLIPAPVPVPPPQPTVEPLPYKPDSGDNTLLYAGLIALGVAGLAGVGFVAMNRKKRR